MSAASNSQRGTLIAVAAIIVGGATAGLLLGRENSAPAQAQANAHADSPVDQKPIANAPPRDVATAPIPAVTPRALTEQELAGLANDSMSGPAASRVAAIDELSKAPRDQALPLLKRAMLNGDPAVDRPAALRGLRELALAQGDSDQRIRDAVREVIYHGDDESLAGEAQEALDVIAESEAK
jgi:hypothetical protein